MTEAEKTEIYNTYKPKVFGYLYNKLQNQHDAEDICADVFVKVYSHLDSFDSSKASMSTWVYRIMQNTLYDHYRTRRVTAEIDESIASDDDFTEQICRDEMLTRLAEVLKELDDRKRELIVLHYYSGKTLKEVAERLGISYSYAKRIHSEALEELNNIF